MQENFISGEIHLTQGFCCYYAFKSITDSSPARSEERERCEQIHLLLGWQSEYQFYIQIISKGTNIFVYKLKMFTLTRFYISFPLSTVNNYLLSFNLFLKVGRNWNYTYPNPPPTLDPMISISDLFWLITLFFFFPSFDIVDSHLTVYNYNFFRFSFMNLAQLI